MSTDQGNAVVVGYGPGIGDAVARAFAAEGHSLALIARDGPKLEGAVRTLNEAGTDCAGYAADAGDEPALLEALARARARFGNPSVLIYNAARWRPGPVLALTPDDLVDDLRICAGGALAAARAVVPAMRAKRQGSLLFTGGGFALHPLPAAPGLSVGKAALRALALMLAEELAPNGIRAGTVTVMGTVAAGTSLAPDRIAQAFLDLHRGRPEAATAEMQIR